MRVRIVADIGYQSNWVEILQTTFMRNALIAGTLVALASGLVGYFVVIRRDTFAAHALAHIGFPGATAAVLLGIPVTVGLAVFCIGGGVAIGAIGKRADRREVATGSILALATALGVLFNSLAAGGASTITSVLFGNLLAISTGQLSTFALFTLVLVVALAFVGRPLLFASIDPQVAEAKGVPVRTLGIVFAVMLALVVTMAIQVVGTLLLFALVVTPPATAIALTARPAVVVSVGTGIGLISVWLGLTSSAMFNLPPSFPIVVVAFAVWATVLVVTRDGRGHAVVPTGDHRPPGHPDRSV